MFTLSKALAILSLAVLVSSRAAPHARSLNHHALAARLASPEPAPVPVPHEARVVKSRKLSKRQNRCRARQEQTSSSQAPAATVAAVPPVVVNPAPEPVAPTTTTQAPAPSPTPSQVDNGNNNNNNNNNNNGGNNSNLPSFMIGTQTGEGTFYDIGLGACGIFNSGNDRIAAVSWQLFDNFPGYTGGNPNNNPICGRRVNVQFEGRSTSVLVVDRCEACAVTDLDFSPAAFADIADFSRGRIPGITWQWA